MTQIKFRCSECAAETIMPDFAVRKARLNAIYCAGVPAIHCANCKKPMKVVRKCKPCGGTGDYQEPFDYERPELPEACPVCQGAGSILEEQP